MEISAGADATEPVHSHAHGVDHGISGNESSVDAKIEGDGNFGGVIVTRVLLSPRSSD